LLITEEGKMGNQLFTEVADLTGLPKQLISEELVSILGKVGTDPHAVTLEDLRMAMAAYLMEVIGTEEAADLTQKPYEGSE
jgi:hypothetical protein